MIIKKISFLVASIISLFILQLFYVSNSNSEDDNSKYFSNDEGVLSLMYHRFNENKYPSTNIRMDIFNEQMNIIKNHCKEKITIKWLAELLKVTPRTIHRKMCKELKQVKQELNEEIDI